jgi:hypothetical protein
VVVGFVLNSLVGRLQTAKRAVEMAIEQTEAEAMQYIKTPIGVKYE